MRRAIYLEAADDDLDSILVRIAYASGSVRLAERFVGQLMDKCDKLAVLPGTFGRARPELLPDIRSFSYKDYVIFFRYIEDRFEVVRIVDGSRDIDAMFERDETETGEP